MIFHNHYIGTSSSNLFHLWHMRHHNLPNRFFLSLFYSRDRSKGKTIKTFVLDISTKNYFSLEIINKKVTYETKRPRILKFRPNISLDPLSFMFVLDRSFKFLRFQIGPLSFEFVLDRSFKFLRFQIGPLSFEFRLTDRSTLA